MTELTKSLLAGFTLNLTFSSEAELELYRDCSAGKQAVKARKYSQGAMTSNWKQYN